MSHFMKLKAPPGAGDPCVAGVTIVSRDGLYEVEAEIGALLIEAFGFAEVVTAGKKSTSAPPGSAPVSRTRRARTATKKS